MDMYLSSRSAVLAYSFQVNELTVICSDHFSTSSFITKGMFTKQRYLIPGSVPTIFQWIKKPVRRKLLCQFETECASDNNGDMESDLNGVP